jgi:hypothetical protein
MLLNLGGDWIMRPIKTFGLSALLALATIAIPALADDNFDLAAGKGQVTVTPKSGWHINQDYSWSIKKGGDKVKSKEDFKLDKASATVTGIPAGTYTLKGAVCSENNCAPFAKDITVQ